MKKFNPTDVPINFVLGYQEINLILTGLGQLPFDHVAQLYQKLQHESTQQIKQAEREFNEAHEWQDEASKVITDDIAVSKS